MRRYSDEEKKVLIGVKCNCCGRKLSLHKGVVSEDFVTVTKQWGYFSNKDGREDTFDICEECYDKWTRNFAIPPQRTERTELFPVT